MRCSIALATYNGEKYVEELLHSLMMQTKKPDEVVIIDDKSTDNTVYIIKEFIKKNCLESWYVWENTENVGWKKNFRRALDKCSGDLIFLCDQDDIWDPAKIYEMCLIMEQNREIKLLTSNYKPLFENNSGEKESFRVKGLKNDDGKLQKIRFEKYYFNCMRPGCTYCLRKELYETLKLKDDCSKPHDNVLWVLSSMEGSLYLYNRILVQFRRHGENATYRYRKNKFSLDERKKFINGTLYTVNWIESFNEEFRVTNKYNGLIIKYKKFIQSRKKALDSMSLIRIMAFVIANIRFYPTLGNAVTDILCVMYKEDV